MRTSPANKASPDLPGVVSSARPSFIRRPTDMRRLAGYRPLCVLLSATTLLLSVPLPLIAQTAPPTPTAPPALTDIKASLEQSRELIKSGDYDHAIEILNATIDSLK